MRIRHVVLILTSHLRPKYFNTKIFFQYLDFGLIIPDRHKGAETDKTYPPITL